MKKIVVTGADGFVGKNLMVQLKNLKQGLRVETITRNDTSLEIIKHKLQNCDIIYHLAGVNRPQDIAEFEEGNVNFTQIIVDLLQETNTKPTIILSSSTQAALENPYGVSKRKAEEILRKYAENEPHISVYVYRLCNVFGKWCKPNYNSAVATFCHNIARDLPITVNNPDAEVELVYVDTVIEHFTQHLSETNLKGFTETFVSPTQKTSVGELSYLIKSFRSIRTTLVLPDFSNLFVKQLHSTYLSYLPEDNFAYDLLERSDNRGTLVELFKSEKLGQVFVSTSHPGITRGNHFHHTKVEKFIVLKGEAVIRFRKIDTNEVIEYPVSGNKIQVVDIPVGYTHHIENVGSEEMLVLFWVNEILNHEKLDTYFEIV
jgi:UDP-2-acetamido-2,6-beta-L-arabino-hexul-4-ose reductase